jgi:hyperosmotically inducible protein
VKQVKNNLQIGKKSWNQALDDKVIGSKIKAKLINEPGIRSLNIDVDVNNGVVTLTGLVEYQHQKNRAIEIAYSAEVGQLFRSIPATDSRAKRPPVPEYLGHP